MDNRITLEEIRKTNRQLIYRYIYDNPRSSSPVICTALGLSRPTVATNLSALEQEGLIVRAGLQENVQVGRRPVLYSINPQHRISIGVEVLERRVIIAAVDLYGNPVGISTASISYKNTASGYLEICSHILSFIEKQHIPHDHVLGICITMQGLASPDGRTLVYGEIMKNTGTGIEVFERYLPFPCSFIHDPSAAALSELQSSPEMPDTMYLSLSTHLGGAIITDRHLASGKHGHHATFEHIQAIADGKPCYCGHRGCWDTVCSMPALTGGEEPKEFFRKMREGDKKRCESWKDFLTYLARLIKDLHLVNDMNIMLGGHLAPFFTEEDVSFLYREVRRLCPFEEDDDFITISSLPAYQISIGAALKYIHAFLESVEETTED